MNCHRGTEGFAQKRGGNSPVSRFVKGGMKAHMPTLFMQSHISQLDDHEVLVRAARLHIIAAEAQWQRRHKSKARIIAAMPDQKEQAIAGRAHGIQARPYQSRAYALPLSRRRHRDRSQRREATHPRAIINIDQAVGGLPNQLIVQQRHMRKQQSALITQTIEQAGFVSASKCLTDQRMQLRDIARLFQADAQIGQVRREPGII